MTDTLEHSFDEEFNINVQKKFLSLLIFDKTWAEMSGFDIIKPSCFENQTLSHICRWIQDYHKKYKRLPTLAVCLKFAQDFVNDSCLSIKDYYRYEEHIKDIFDLQETDDLEFYKDKAIEFTRKVAWKKLLEKGGETLKVGNFEEAIDAFRKILSIGSENDLGLDMSDLSVDTFLKDLAESYDKEKMLQTGIVGWDRALGGGFVKNNLHLIGACFPSYTKVTTNKGCLTIKELLEKEDLSDISIASWDGEKTILSKISDVFETKKVKQLISLTLSNGKKVTCTPEHRFVIMNPRVDDTTVIWENNIAYKEAKDLDSQDIL